MFVLQQGDLAYWLNEDGLAVRVKVKLITQDRIYFEATSDDPPMKKGQVGFEFYWTRRVCPRDAVYFHKGKPHVDWSSVVVKLAR